ncbi:hypothetical protein DL96DRAFT_868423 [Flagelloscypha sp. PMI_526]|nr:hypothetical protein DL96DRAFT_868423 [Flagelloscypha sp. PMI_526]
MSNSTVSRGQVSAAMAEAIIKLSESTKVIAMLQTCALAILIWDWSITLGIEIKYVWPSKWNLGKILFFLTRYLPFIDALACLSRSRVVYGNSAVYCPTQFHAETWIVTIGTHIAELILVLRTWAICGRKRWILIGFLAFQTAILIYNGVALEIFVRSIVWAGPEFAGIPGCLMKSAPGKTLFSVTYINIAVFETCIFVATMIACLQKDGGRSQLARIIWRDGLIFYVLIVLVSIINVIIMFTVPVRLPFLPLVTNG